MKSRSRSRSRRGTSSGYYSGSDDDGSSERAPRQKHPRGTEPTYPSSCDPEKRTPSVSYGREYNEQEIRHAKKYIRDDVDVDAWNSQGYARTVTQADLEAPQDTIRRVKYQDWTPKTFREEFEIPSQPVIFTGIMEADNWAAPTKWTLENLLETYGDMPFDVGPNYPYMSLAKYFEYCKHQDDDAPIYVFEPRFAEHYPQLATEYTPPIFFTDDFYKFMGEGPRPFYRWILVGPIRTGGGIHQDPFETSAWNTLVSGRKRWCMFPPDTDGEFLSEPDGMEDESIVWYREKYAQCKNLPGMIECVQQPGETIFIPGGWWHVVVNLEWTVSVTANFASRVNWRESFATFKNKKPRYARLLYRKVPPKLRNQVNLNGLSSYSTTTYSEEVKTASDGALSPSAFA